MPKKTRKTTKKRKGWKERIAEGSTLLFLWLFILSATMAGNRLSDYRIEIGKGHTSLVTPEEYSIHLCDGTNIKILKESEDQYLFTTQQGKLVKVQYYNLTRNEIAHARTVLDTLINEETMINIDTINFYNYNTCSVADNGEEKDPRNSGFYFEEPNGQRNIFVQFSELYIPHPSATTEIICHELGHGIIPYDRAEKQQTLDTLHEIIYDLGRGQWCVIKEKRGEMQEQYENLTENSWGWRG